jgi:hypothetical protein
LKVANRRIAIGAFAIILIAYLGVLNSKASHAVGSNLALAQARPTFPPDRPTFPPTPHAHEAQPEDICLRLAAEPSSMSIPAGTVIYRLAAQNNGRGRAANVHVRLPFVPDTQTLLDAHFTKPNAWLSAILTDSIELHFGSLVGDEIVTATLWLRTAPNAQIGTSIATRARVDWDGQANTALSNRVSLVIARADASNAIVPLEIAPATGDSAANFAIIYDGFASHEQVSMWYHQPDGRVVALGEMRADTQGRISLTFPEAVLASGRYMFVAYGQCSQVTAVGSFTVSGKQP